MGDIVVEKEFVCSSEPRKLWRMITDTERLNRAIGLGKIHLSANESDSAARYKVSTVSGGFPLEYEEQPYEWVENQHFQVRRVVTKGLVDHILNSFSVSLSDEGQTKLRVRIELAPKIGILAPIMRMQVRRFVDRIVREFEQIDRALAQGKEADYSSGKPRVEWPVLERAAAALIERVGEEQRSAATKLIDFVSTAPDVEVDRMRPFELADTWRVDRRATLALCLHAVTAGLLELNWDVVCPSCRTASARVKSLEELDQHGGCHLCDIQFTTTLDDAVEATFRPARALRELDEGPYCIGGPARTPHVFAQVILPPGASVTLPAPEHAGRYRLFVRGGAKAIVEVTPDGRAEATFSARGADLLPTDVTIAPGGQIQIDHADDIERHAKLERVEWANQAATAHVVSTLPDFRRLFASEVLRPGLTLSVQRVTLVFTDLTDSTAMYSAMGDAKAFTVVQDHFQVLERVVAGHGGVIVKTIGDAVMAAFTEESEAVIATMDMHRALGAWRETHPDGGEIRLKIGLYAGPCYAVTANGVLDYFGQTVNVAARLQGKAGPGEVVLADALATEASRQGWLDDVSVGERFDATLKGVDGVIRLARVNVDPLGDATVRAMKTA